MDNCENRHRGSGRFPRITKGFRHSRPPPIGPGGVNFFPYLSILLAPYVRGSSVWDSGDHSLSFGLESAGVSAR
jgi:hypothetical protein